MHADEPLEMQATHALGAVPEGAESETKDELTESTDSDEEEKVNAAEEQKEKKTLQRTGLLKGGIPAIPAPTGWIVGRATLMKDKRRKKKTLQRT